MNKFRISLACIALGCLFGAIGPSLRILPIPGISRYDLKDPGSALFWTEMDIYLWPTHLLAWAEGIWTAIAVGGNLAFFVTIAFIVAFTIDRAMLRSALIGAILTFLASVCWFLAGFNLAHINPRPLGAGLVFYLAFLLITDRVIRIVRRNSAVQGVRV